MCFWKFLFGLFIGTAVPTLYRIVKGFKMKGKRKGLTSKDECFFFSPSVACLYPVEFESKTFCSELCCSFCNYKKLISHIKSTRSHLDICMYLITADELTEILLKLFRCGVFLRIITDKQMSNEAMKCKLRTFYKHHVPIKVLENFEIMHNKFVIVDNEKLITGSLNWTRQAFFQNCENVIIVSNPEVVQKYTDYFNFLWG